MVHMINFEGKVSGGEVRLPFADPAIQFGAGGVFETLRLEGRRVHRYAAHRQRLMAGLEFLQLRLAFGEEALWDLMARESSRFPPEEGLRIRLTIGADPGAAESEGRAACRAFVEARPLEPSCRGRLDARPTMSLWTLRDYTVASADPWRQHKTTQYYPQAEARRRARAHGYDEALLLNERGEMVEASAHNIFWLKGERLLTPSPACGALPGTFAAYVREQAGRAGLKVEELGAAPEAMSEADAVLLTNSIGEIRSVTRWDRRAYPALSMSAEGMRLLELVEGEREQRADLDLGTSPGSRH